MRPYRDLSDILEDCEGEREAMREDLELAFLSICSTLEKISELQSEPMLRLKQQKITTDFFCQQGKQINLTFRMATNKKNITVSDRIRFRSYFDAKRNQFKLIIYRYCTVWYRTFQFY